MIGDFRISKHSAGPYMVYVEAGTDPADGMPLTYAKVATRRQLRLWQQGKFEELTDSIQDAGCPVEVRCPPRRRPWLKRAWDRLRGKGGSQTTVQGMQPKFAPELVPAIEEYRCDNGRVQIVTSGQETEKLQ